MIIRKIDTQIAQLKADQWDGLAERLTIFKALSGITEYLDADRQAFTHYAHYLDLLKGIAKLVSSQVQITDMNGSMAGTDWRFDFMVGGKPHSFTLKDNRQGTFQDAFLESLNQAIHKQLGQKKVRAVLVMSAEQADQSLCLALLPDPIYEKLQQHNPSYA